MLSDWMFDRKNQVKKSEKKLFSEETKNKNIHWYLTGFTVKFYILKPKMI